MAATTSDVIPITAAWSADLAAGATAGLIQLRGSGPVLVYFGSDAPAADFSGGFWLSNSGETVIEFGAPIFAGGDKVFARAPFGVSGIVVGK